MSDINSTVGFPREPARKDAPAEFLILGRHFLSKRLRHVNTRETYLFRFVNDRSIILGNMRRFQFSENRREASRNLFESEMQAFGQQNYFGVRRKVNEIMSLRHHSPLSTLMKARIEESHTKKARHELEKQKKTENMKAKADLPHQRISFIRM